MSGLMSWEVAEVFHQHTSILLYIPEGVRKLVINDGPHPTYGHHLNELHGPYIDPDNDDVRIFLNYRKLGRYFNIQPLVQDQEDDVFLNCGAAGTEKYHKVHVSWSTPEPVR